MLRKGNSVFEFIKTNSKASNAKVKDMQTQLNQVIYNHNLGYLSPSTASYIYNQFVEIGKEISAIEVTPVQKQHKEEVLTILRKNCQNVREYSKNKLDKSDIPTAESIIKFRLYTFIKDRRDGLLTNSNIISHLEQNDDIYHNILEPLGLENFNQKDIKNFIDINIQLLTLLNQKYNYEQER